MSRSCGRHIETHSVNTGAKAGDLETPIWLSPSLPSPNHPCSSSPPGASSHPVALFLQDTDFSQPCGATFLVSISLSLRASFSSTSESSEVAFLPPLPLSWRTLFPPFPPGVACLFTNSFHQKNVFLAFLQSPSGHSFIRLTNIYLEFNGLLGTKYCTRQRCG